MEGLGVSSVQHLQALSSLLSTQHGDEGDEGDEDFVRRTCISVYLASTSREKKNNKDIWSEEEVAEGSQYDDLADPRPQPEYEILLKQSVGTEDLFLGLNRKDPSSMCCEAMLVKIKLPDTEATDVVLDVKEKFLDLRTPKYKLGLHLPHPTHSHGGTARFFPESGALEVTLLFKRPMDEINMP
uniref:Dynein axonemal assembly factor 6 n=1 Tax=Cyclopterus lumpus TaxID=8103 RepID=A0A8C2ZN26_CYCLU